MNEDKLNFNDPNAIPGVITKVSKISPLEITEDDLKKINKYTLTPITAEEVFTFKAVIADNEQDDRNYMPFNLKALQDLKKLYPGKTMLKDHDRKSDNQIAKAVRRPTRPSNHLGKDHRTHCPAPPKTKNPETIKPRDNEKAPRRTSGP